MSTFGIVGLSFLLVQVQCLIPDYIRVCRRDVPDLTGCIAESIEVLRPRLRIGIEELEVPGLEPFLLDTLVIESVTGASSIATNLTDVRIDGASNFIILKINPKFTKNGFNFGFDVNVPHLDITGNYKMDTKILFLQLKGEGPFRANISDYHFVCTMKGSKVQRDGSDYLFFDPMKCDLAVGKVFIYLDNLFNGNEILGKATNAVINDNSDIFFEEIKPNLLNALAKNFTQIANKITLAFRFDELFP